MVGDINNAIEGRVLKELDNQLDGNNNEYD